MKIINGEEIFGVEDVKFDKESECEHCGVLPPFTATLDDDCTHWCMDCANHHDNFQMSKEEWKAVNVYEQMLQMNYYKEQYESLFKHLEKIMKEFTLEEVYAMAKINKE